MAATGSVYVTEPVGPTRDEIASDGSPLPPPISSTFCPIPIRASSTRPDVNGANICAMSTRYLSQYRAEACQTSRALFSSSGFILVRWGDPILLPYSYFFRSLAISANWATPKAFASKATACRSFAAKGQENETFWRTKDGSANRRLRDRSP